MIQGFRKLFQSRLGVVLALGFVGLIAIAFASADMTGSSFGGIAGGERVATVGDEQISTGSYRETLNGAFDRERQENPQLTLKQFIAGGGDTGVLDAMIERLAVFAFAAPFADLRRIERIEPRARIEGHLAEARCSVDLVEIDADEIEALPQRFGGLDHPVQHIERQIGVAKQLFAAMDIARDDKAKRMDWVLRGFRQFDAPVCVIVTYDRVLDGSDDTPFDCGAVTTALVNAAWSRGLGCVINSQGIMQSPVVREHAGIPEDQVIMKAVALGWPDPDFPANAVVSFRKSVDEAARFVGFD